MMKVEKKVDIARHIAFKFSTTPFMGWKNTLPFGFDVIPVVT